MTAAQALTHPWLRGNHNIPVDILVYKLVIAYIRASSLKRAALKALSKTLTEDELFYLRVQFSLLQPNRDGCINFDNFRGALVRNRTDAMKEAKIFEILNSMEPLKFKKMDFQEFCAAAISVHQLEALERWEQYARTAYEYFERDGNRVINVDQLAREVGLSATVPAHVVFHDWVRHMDGKLSFTGFTKLLHGVTPRTTTRHQ
ncbi:hypothetical protein KP509_30G018000 [Ceratopteris richardii]|nr:hypothetical protein KP509_30G018000 [Ceratopteris richardii]